MQDSVGIASAVSLEYQGHGEYTIAKYPIRSAKKSLTDVKVGDYVQAQPTSDSDFYAIGNKYLSNVYDDTYLLMDKISLDINNCSNNEAFYCKYGISDYLQYEINAVITKQKQFGNSEFKIEVFVPSVDTVETKTRGNEPLGETYYIYNYDGGIYNLKDVSVKYSNLSTGLVQKTGTSSLTYAKAFKNLVVSAVGIVSKTVSAFGFMQSAYDVYKAYIGEVMTSSSNDLIYTNIIYDRIVKETYVRDDVMGDYPSCGCVSQKVWLNRNDTYQYYGQTGESYLLKKSLNSEQFSENFINPAPVAIQNGIVSIYIDGSLRTSIYGVVKILEGF